MYKFGQPVVVTIDGGSGHRDNWIDVWVSEIELKVHIRY